MTSHQLQNIESYGELREILSDIRIDDPRIFPPQEDHYERLWTPQRMSYILRDKSQDDASIQARSDDSTSDTSIPISISACPFCDSPRTSDEEGLIVWRGAHVFIIMNLYPYNSGHVMVCPYEHVGMLTDLDDTTLLEFEKATQLAMRIIADVSRPDGYNIGINQGEAGGAGVSTHLHQHIVPRWNGDSNFMPIVGQTRTIPILLENQRQAYATVAGKLAQGMGLPLDAGR